jgi:lipoyl(octanoyl) transferase
VDPIRATDNVLSRYSVRSGDRGFVFQRPPSSLPVFDLGVAPYVPVQDLQRRLRQAVIDGKIRGVLLLLEHEPVITLGTRAGVQDLRSASNAASSTPSIDIVESERGGQATLHAPGQLISYPILPIPGRDLPAYVHGLEEILALLLSGLGIQAVRKAQAPGLYVAGAKIASVGLRCSHWVASHGTSLNVSVDLSLFDLIVSCGDPGLRQTSVGALARRNVAMAEIKERYLQAAQQVFDWDLSDVQTVRYDQVETLLGLL